MGRTRLTLQRSTPGVCRFRENVQGYPGNLDLSRVAGTTQGACLILASCWAFMGARGVTKAPRTQSHSPSSGTGGITVAHPESWVQTGDSLPQPYSLQPASFSCSAEGVKRTGIEPGSPQGQGLLAAPCTSQACVHTGPFPLLDTLTPVPSVSSQTSLLSGESLSNPSPSVTLTTAPPPPHNLLISFIHGICHSEVTRL